jgi:hypothetical protein
VSSFSPLLYRTTSLHDFKIHPLCGHPVFLVGQPVRNDDLKNVFTGRQVDPQFQPAGNNQTGDVCDWPPVTL